MSQIRPDDPLWTRLAAGDDEARARLVRDHMGLVHSAARSMARRLSDEVTLDDLVSSGTVGLIRALDSFEPDRGHAFSTYAIPRIRGAIYDDLRCNDTASRSLRKREREVAEARSALEQLFRRSPTDTELAERLGVNVEDLWATEGSLLAMSTVPLDAPTQREDGEGASLADVLGDDAESAEDALLREERGEQLKIAIQSLKQQEQVVLALYYYEGLKQPEIADVMELTESRISQIRSKAIRKLKDRMAAL